MILLIACVMTALVLAFLSVSFAVIANDVASSWDYRLRDFIANCAASLVFMVLAAEQVMMALGIWSSR